MGNHDAGRAMGRAAEMALKTRTTETALELLDEICRPYANCDAEFESEDPRNPGHVHPDYNSYTDPNGPLGRLINEAFDPERDWARELAEFKGEDLDEFFDKWSDPGGPAHKFRRRYRFW